MVYWTVLRNLKSLGWRYGRIDYQQNATWCQFFVEFVVGDVVTKGAGNSVEAWAVLCCEVG